MTFRVKSLQSGRKIDTISTVCSGTRNSRKTRWFWHRGERKTGKGRDLSCGKKRKKLAQKRKKIGIAAAAVIVAAAGSTLIYHNLPQTKVEKQLTLAAKYMTEMNYLEAQEAYTEALSIDEGSVRAYRGLADDYAAQGQLDEAAEILHQGYETTQSEILLQNYCATVLNSVVEHVNEKTAGLDDIRSCLTVLESDPDNESVRSVLENCVQQVTVQEDTASLMLDELDGTSDFDEYADVAEKLLGLAERTAATRKQHTDL